MNRNILIKLLLALLLCGGVTAQASTKKLLLHVEQPELPWGKTEFIEKLTWHLSKMADLRIMNSARLDESMPAFPQAGYDLDSLVEWGKEVGGRYILFITINKERLETQKRFTIPLLVHRYVTAGVIEGEVRLVDVQRGRVLVMDRFSESVRARQVIQADSDHNPHDPELQVPADEKSGLFATLEDKLAGQIADKTKSKVRGR